MPAASEFPVPIDPASRGPLLDFPHTSAELSMRADQTAKRLINDPALLSDLVYQSEGRLLTARESRDDEAENLVNNFLGQVRDRTRTFNWFTKKDESLSTPKARAILLHLPQPEEESTGHEPALTTQKVQEIARGYIDRRFEVKARPDWRGALKSLKGFLESTVFPPDMELMAKWFHLRVGGYAQVMAVNQSVAWRSVFLGARAVHPKDVDMLRMASDIDQSASLMAEFLGRRSDFQQNSREYNNFLGIQYSIVESLYRGRINPLSGQKGKTYYAIALEDPKTVGDIRSRYGILDFEDIARTIPTPDLLDVARDSARVALDQVHYGGRYQKLMDALNSSFSTEQHRTGMLTPMGIPKTDSGELDFPYNIYFARSPVKDAFYGLRDHKTLRKELNKQAEDQARQKGIGWQAVPFAIKGIQGYAIAKDVSRLSPAETVRMVAEYLERHQVRENWVNRQEKDNPNISARVLNFDEVGFVLVNRDLVEQSPLSALLDLKIPDDIRLRALEILTENSLLRRDLPPRFTRMPTRAGDLYVLEHHPDMPGLVESSIIRRKTSGGLEFNLTFCTDSLVYPDGEKPKLSGSVDFQDGRVNIKFGEDSLFIEADQQWIVDGIILRLIERSCCPLFSEVQAERSVVDTEGHLLNSIPGYIGHLAEGKHFTARAEGIFSDVVRELWGDTQGISLAQINKRHRRDDPGDHRFLTYFSGKELEVTDEQAVQRSSPQKLTV